MNLREIEVAAARYLEKDVDALTQDGIDLGLVALNNIRQTAELQNDFNFTRKLLAVSVDGVTGGSLDTAVEYGTTTPVISVKTVVDVGTFDVDGNFIPVDWTTVAQSLDIQRQDNAYRAFRYPTDAQSLCGQKRFVFSGQKLYVFPRTPNTVFNVGIEAYTFTPDWGPDDVKCDTANGYVGPWTQKGSQYLLWSTIIHLNHLFKGFVFRQEGNLPPPQTIADAGLAALMTWDIFQYEQFRRHSR